MAEVNRYVTIAGPVVSFSASAVPADSGPAYSLLAFVFHPILILCPLHVAQHYQLSQLVSR